MASRFAGFGVRSVAAFEESSKGLNERRIELDGGIRALEEAKVLVIETNKAVESLNDGVNEKGFEDMDGSANQIAKMMARSNDFMLDMIAKDLDLKFGCVEKAKGGSGSWREMNLVGNLNLWRETVGKATKERGVKSSLRDQGFANQIVPCFKSLANTFSTEAIVKFIECAATHPGQVRTSFAAEKQAELTAFNRWKRSCHLSSFEKGEISEYEDVNKTACAIPSFEKMKRKRSPS